MGSQIARYHWGTKLNWNLNKIKLSLYAGDILYIENSKESAKKKKKQNLSELIKIYGKVAAYKINIVISCIPLN